MDRVFLDANVLYSAAYDPESSLRRFWDLPEVELWSSMYAVAEAMRNLRADYPGQVVDLERLVDALRVHVQPGSRDALPGNIALVVKDRPILWAAIQVHATHLATGDRRHFGALYGQTIAGVLILRPSDYLHGRSSPT